MDGNSIWMLRKLILYLFRWQLSTPILWVVLNKLGNDIKSTIIANLIGGLIFFWVDRLLLKDN